MSEKSTAPVADSACRVRVGVHPSINGPLFGSVTRWTKTLVFLAIDDHQSPIPGYKGTGLILRFMRKTGHQPRAARGFGPSYWVRDMSKIEAHISAVEARP